MSRGEKRTPLPTLPGRFGRFSLRVLRGFRLNQGLLLSGAVAYYTLLSVIPMLILMLVVLSHFVAEERLLQMVSAHLELIMPGYAATLTEQVKGFLEHRQVVGAVGFVVMLFFSSLAFTVLENALSIIFFHRVRVKRRHFLVSAIIPYLYILVFSIGMLAVSFIAGALDTFGGRELAFWGLTVNVETASATALYLLGIVGEVLLLTSVYLVMPVGRITFYHAFAGGLSATVLWELTRRALVWYFSTLSLVNLIYGSFAAAIVSLLSIEVAAIIILFCAQVIAELDRSVKAGRRKAIGFRT